MALPQSAPYPPSATGPAPSQAGYPPSHGNPPPPPLNLGSAGPPSQAGPSVMQILAMGQERNHAADAVAHHPRIESLMKLGKEAEATWLGIANTAESLGDLDRAVQAYESVLRHNAYSVVALTQIASICRSKEEFKKAAEYFGRVVGLAPESGEVWGALGHCYLMIDDLKKAYSSYQQALYYMPNPQEPKLWYGIGILYDRYGSLEHAEEAFSSVIRMDPNFEKANEIFFRLGIIYKQQRKSTQSLDCFRYILQNPPRPLTEIDIWFQIGHVYEQQKDFLAAKDSYERVLAENPAHAKVLQQLGGLYHRARAPFYNPEISVQILTKSLESDPNDPFSWYLLGRAYMTTNNFGKAYEAYQQAVYRDGKNPAFWCSIGVLYYNINQFHDALDAYSRAIRIHPYLAEVWFNLGALYESCNDQMTDAIDAYQRTLQLDHTNTIVSTRLREIRDHQKDGTPLSPPPQPKDISPSSLSWNYASSASSAPAQLASGLGPELSPAMSRPPGTAGSPTNGHRFEGPPPSNGRPHSTEPYRDDRRRSSGEHQSPHSASRNSGPSQSLLPQIKSIHDGRGSPAIPSSSDMHRRGSPVSPRTRHSDNVSESSYPPPQSYPYPSRGPEGEPRGSMDWDRNGRNGSGSGSSHRRSPPGSSHSHGSFARDSFSYSQPPPLQRSPPPSNRRSIDDRNGGGYPHARPDATDNERRRGSSPRPTGLPAMDVPASENGTPVPVVPPVKGKGGRAKKDDSSPNSPSSVHRKEPKAKKAAAEPGVKKERKAPAKKARANGAPAVTSPILAKALVSTDETSSTASSPKASTPAATIVPPSREVDEDYDEGVDALMGLAASASVTHSPPQPTLAETAQAASSVAALLDSASLPPLPTTPTPPSPVEDQLKEEDVATAAPLEEVAPEAPVDDASSKKRPHDDEDSDASVKRQKPEEETPTVLEEPAPVFEASIEEPVEAKEKDVEEPVTQVDPVAEGSKSAVAAPMEEEEKEDGEVEDTAVAVSA